MHMPSVADTTEPSMLQAECRAILAQARLLNPDPSHLEPFLTQGPTERVHEWSHPGASTADPRWRPHHAGHVGENLEEDGLEVSLVIDACCCCS